MNKLELAHDYAKIILRNSVERGYNLGTRTGIENIVDVAFDLSEAMLSENEKRKDKSRPEVLEEWQPDWSQAPNESNYWAMDGDGSCNWYKYEPEISGYHWGFGRVTYSAPDFDYQGEWMDSLRKRP